jgi:hypothetical protein
MTTEKDDWSEGSELGGFGHSESIEPGVLDDQKSETEHPKISVPVLADPEGLVGAHDVEGEK